MPKRKRSQAPKRSSLFTAIFQDSPSQGSREAWILLSLFLVFVLVISYSNIRSLDFWWHLKSGEWILQNKTIPVTDPFSHSAPGKPWISHEWLFGLLSHLVYRIGDVTGIVVAKAILIALTFGLCAWVARLRGATPGLILLVLTASYAIARFRFNARPDFLSLPLAVGSILIYEMSRKRPWLLMLLPLMQLVWVNGHGGTALLGWGLAGAFLLDLIWRNRSNLVSPKKLWGDRELMWMGSSFGGVLLLSFLNPHKAKVLTYGLLRSDSPLDNKEFQSLFELMETGMDVSILLFIAFAAALVSLFLVRPRQVQLYEWLLCSALLILTVIFFRFRTHFVFLLAPTLAWHLSQVRWLSRTRWWLTTAMSLALMGQVAFKEAGAYFYRFGPAVHDGIFPRSAVAFLKSAGVSGNMFNTYGIGGYLIWNLWPEQRVFIDGREDVYYESGVLEEYLECFESRDRWNNLVSKYDIDFAILNYPENVPTRPERSREVIAFPRKTWALVYFDDVVTIYLRRNRMNDAVIQNYEIHFVQPLQLSSYLDTLISDPAKLDLFLGEMQTNLEAHPNSFRAHFTLGVLAVKRGRDFLGEAERHFLQAIAINPDFAPAYTNLGSIYLFLGRLAQAERMFEKALSLDRNAAAEESLQRVRQLRN
jgi:tetratricopeptide (TPR) repeat protein